MTNESPTPEKQEELKSLESKSLLMASDIMSVIRYHTTERNMALAGLVSALTVILMPTLEDEQDEHLQFLVQTKVLVDGVFNEVIARTTPATTVQ